MAESAVSFAIEKLLSFVVCESKLIGGLPREIQAINNELGSIKVFLKDAEEKAEEDDRIKEWVRQVRDIAYQIEDSIDQYMLLYHRHLDDQNRFLRVFVNVAGCVLHWKHRHDIATAIKDIKAEIDDTNRRREIYQFKTTESSSSRLTKWEDPRVFSLYVEESELVGIDDPKTDLMGLMDLGQSNVSSVISVVGMGGIGKTTLVRKVFDDMQVRKHFPLYAWIMVSRSYRKVDVLRNLLKQFHRAAKETMPRESETLDDEESIIDRLRSYLEGKRYLVVLDDVWDAELWMCIKSALPGANNGGKILITTRLENVALAWKASSTDHVYNLQPLSPDAAWDLFCKKTFQQTHCPQELKEPSLDIVKKCGGLPLAILTIGALLSTKRKSVSEWKKLRDSIGSELGNHPHFTSVRRILLLSYHELPYYLKPCFLYFGIFPEDYSVDRMRLVRLWVAEGFVKQHREKTLEEVAEEYLTELVHRSLVLVSQVDRARKAKSFRVHDIMRDLILSKLEDMSFCQVLNRKNSKVDSQPRRFSIQHSSTIHAFLKSNFTKKCTLRSLFFFINGPETLPNVLITKFLKVSHLMKVLDLQDAPVNYLPDEIGNLYCLHYLSLRNTKVKVLPRSIGQLQELQTLDLKQSLILKLPREMKRLHNLRHILACSDDASGLRIPRGVLGVFKELQSLQNLDGSIAGLVNELKNLKLMRCLAIAKVKREDGFAHSDALQEMKDLGSLSLASNENEVIDLQSIESPPPLLEFLSLKGPLEKSKLPDWIQKLNNLSRLRLRGSRIKDDPLKYLQLLPNLIDLNLVEEGYEGEKLVFGSMGFLKLKMLRLHDLRNLRQIVIEPSCLLQLQELMIGACPELEGAPSGMKYLSNLTTLSLSDMPTEFIASILPEKGPYYSSVKHVPNVYIRLYSTQENRWVSHLLHQYSSSSPSTKKSLLEPIGSYYENKDC